MSSFVLKLFGEKRFVKSANVFPASIKLTKPIQKYLHIIESYACTLKIFVFMFLFCEALQSGEWKTKDEGRLINVLISFGICSTPEESK